MTIPEMLAVLFSYGMSQTAIAEKVGVSQPTIYRASKGSALSYTTGKKVEELYLEIKRKSGPLPSPPRPPAFSFIPAHDSQALEATA